MAMTTFQMNFRYLWLGIWWHDKSIQLRITVMENQDIFKKEKWVGGGEWGETLTVMWCDVIHLFFIFFFFALFCFNSSISNKTTDISWLLRITPARTGVPVSYVQLLFFPTEQQEFRQMYVINSEMLICTADESLNNSTVIKLKLFIPCKQPVLYFTPHFKIYHNDRFSNVRISYQKNSKKLLNSCC